MPTEISLPLLDRVRIASPCSAKWEQMSGDDKARHCSQCDLNVYNLSNMTSQEAEALLRTKLENPARRVCASFYRRADGTILVKDCPIGLREVRQRALRIASRIVAALGIVMLGARAAARSQPEDWQAWGWSLKLCNLQPFQALIAWLNPPSGGGWSGEISLPDAPPALKSTEDQFGPHPSY